MSTQRPVADPTAWPPDLRHLLAGDVSAALAAAARSEGHEVVRWRPRQVTHRVGRSTVVQYRVRTERRGRAASDHTYVLAHGIDLGGAAVDGVRSGGFDLAAWRFPADPLLPGLAKAFDALHVESYLGELGHHLGPVTLDRRAYRAGRRAVVEATGPDGSAFLKVVRPDDAEDLADQHHRLVACMPVPHCVGRTPEGLLVLETLPGRTLRAALRVPGADPTVLPGLTEVEALLDRLPDEVCGSGRPRNPLRTLRRHARLLATVLPGLGPRIDTVVDTVADQLGSASARSHATVAVHGDLYESQILVTEGRVPSICGILDLDTVGPGNRIDDIANLCSHLSVLTLRTDADRVGPPEAPVSAGSGAVATYLGALLRDAEDRFDRAELRARIAGRVVGMATGPFRVQEAGWPVGVLRRIELAEGWLASSRG